MFKEFVTERCWPGYKPAPGKKAYEKGSCVKEDEQGVAEGKKPDRYHIVGKDGKPVNLASYPDRDSAIKDRDEKHPGAVVQQVGPRGKVKGVTEVWKGHSSTVKNPNFNDELSYRRVNPVGKRLKSGKLSADERGSQERTKALIKYTQKRGGLAGPKGPLPEEQDVAEDWQKVNRQDKTDGLSPAAVKAYRRENPGSKLQTAVTEKNPKGKRAKRRLSFCRRMKGMKARLTSAENSRDPDSPINKALRRWNC